MITKEEYEDYLNRWYRSGRVKPDFVLDGVIVEPSWLKLARKHIGTHEFEPGSNPRVETYYLEAMGKKYTDDVPWCAAFVGAMLRRAGIKPTNSLLAKSYLKWGVPLERPRPGCIAILQRGEGFQGHVGFFVSDNGDGTINLLGGNQQDAVSIATYPEHRVIDYRWPKQGA